MKLLSDTTSRGRFISWIAKYHLVGSVIGYAVGLIWMVVLAHEELSAKNYFSENQLLPGLVESYYSDYRYAGQVYHHLHTICHSKRLVRSYFEEELTKFGLDIYQQNFHIHKQNKSGVNSYAIYRAPRASGVESIVLNVPLHDNCNGNGAVSLMMSLAKYFSKDSFWAKDIIFLLSDNDRHGVQAWLSAYYNDFSKDIYAEELAGHGGSIQAAVVFDFKDKYVNHFDLLIEGVNGQLVNLDIVNLVYRIGNLERLPVKFAHQDRFNIRNSEFMANFENMFGMMIQQASGHPSGNHGMFFKYRVESVTLRGHTDQNSRKYQVHFEQMGRFAEGIFRSINNMLEHFHQSFFLYVLPNTQRYVSIGLYMPPIGCLVFLLVVQTFAVWIKVFNLEEIQRKKDIEFMEMVPLTTLFLPSVYQLLVASILLSFFCSILLPEVISIESNYLTNTKFDSLIFMSSFYGACIAALRIFKPEEEIACRVVVLYVTVITSLLIGVVCIWNFSLGFFIAVFTIPFVVTANIYFKRLFVRALAITVHFMFNPLLCAFYLYVLSNLSFQSFDSLRIITEPDFWFEQSNGFYSMMVFASAQTMSCQTKNIVEYMIVPLWFVTGTLL